MFLKLFIFRKENFPPCKGFKFLMLMLLFLKKKKMQ